jgi:hypothetical protein
MPFHDPDTHTPQNQPAQSVDDFAVSETEITLGPSMAAEAQQEKQVRLTAQRLLYRHLHVDPDGSKDKALPETYWDDVTIDLTDAYLVNLDFNHCRLHKADFSNATFIGGNFQGVQFTEDAWFVGAKFSGDAWFAGAQFIGHTAFVETRFSGHAVFTNAQFRGYAGFADAQFSGSVRFDEAQFGGNTTFGNVRFCGSARFDQASFRLKPSFDGATATHSGEHVWPYPYHVEPQSSEERMGRLVQGPEPDQDQAIETASPEP